MADIYSGGMVTVSWQTPLKSGNYDKVLASQWIRCLQLMPYLEKMGVKCELNTSGESADVVVFTRWQGKKALEKAKYLKSLGKKLVFDLVVDYFPREGVEKRNHHASRQQIEDCLRMVDISDAVTCASLELRDVASRYHDQAVYLPDSINFNHFRNRKEATDFLKGPPTVVWSGIWTKVDDLDPILPVINDLGLHLKVITNYPTRVSNSIGKKCTHLEVVKWKYETFPREILTGDIGVSPRETDSIYNRSHSSFKILALMAQGLPTLASSLRSYEEVLSLGGGYICYEIEDWLIRLQELTSDAALLSAMSQSAREIVRNYSTDLITESFSNLAKSLLEKDA